MFVGGPSWSEKGYSKMAPMNETPRSVLVALTMLTFVTGIVDAASVLGLGHVFTANMTGNVVFLGFALVGKGNTSAIASIAAIVSFLAGALVGGRLAKVLTAKAIRVGFAIEFIALALAAGAASSDATIVAVGLLAFAMGLRNALVRRLAVADMTTTVLTLTLAGLAADSSLAGGTNPRWGRRASAVLAMLAGAALGAALLSKGPGVVVAAAVVFEMGAMSVLLRGGVGASAVEPALKPLSMAGEHR